MNHRIMAALFLVPLTTSVAFCQTAPDVADRPAGRPGELTIEPAEVTIRDGRTALVDAGTLLVPENRAHPTGKAISIPFYRLRSTASDPGEPIFLLAGGPGSSWIDNFENPENFDEVQFYRTIGDVVLFDQRGGGHSLPKLTCDERLDLPLEEPLEMSTLTAGLRAASVSCRDRWTQAGVDLKGYTTVESAADTDALRAALGYEKMTLVGGSYGSHLALALMRRHPASIARVVLHGVEGLDQTWDDPAGRLAAYERHAAAAEASARFRSHIPAGGLLAALRTVLERLDREPVLVTVEVDGTERRVTVDATLVRMIAGYQAGQRNRPWLWPEFILGMYNGDYSLPARAAIDFRRFPLDDPMHYMMDCASGISPSRRDRYHHGPAVELLGDINWEYEQLCDAWGAPDLGEEFRSPLVSPIPTVIVHGTWDTSTPIENAREVVSTLENGQLIEVMTGNHGGLYNLYTRWPPIYDLLGAFLRGEEVRFPPNVELTVDFGSATPSGE